MAGALTTHTPPLRNHIAMDEELEVKYWTKHLGVTREELQRAVDKSWQFRRRRLQGIGENWRRPGPRLEA
jgi:hypothetical protein